MALKPYNGVKQTSYGVLYAWDALLNGDHGATLAAAHLSDKTIQVRGTFGVGGSVTLYGSNNPADIDVAPASGSDTWVILKDNLDNNLVKTALGGDIVIENYWYICPKVTAGDGTTNLNVSISARGS